MKKFIPLFTLFLLLGAGDGFAQNGFAQEDRELLKQMQVSIKQLEINQAKLEAKIEEMEKRFEQRFEQNDKRFERIENKMENQFYVIISAMLMLVGFILWDRRTFIKPFDLKVKDVETAMNSEKAKMENLVSALRELAKNDTKVAQVLKQFNLF